MNMTVRELMDELEDMPEDVDVIFSYYDSDEGRVTSYVDRVSLTTESYGSQTKTQVCLS